MKFQGALRACIVVALSALACGAPETGGGAASTARGMTTTNGVFQNGLTTNGVWQNGVWQNGVWQNGVWQNGVWQNGVWQNGVWQNGVWQNGVWQNGVWQNGVWQNGVWQNGVWQNGVWQNGLQGDALRSSPLTRKVLQYIYACAMPGTTDSLGGPLYRTTLDPNHGALACAPGGTCDDGYICSSQGTCVIQLDGAIGLGINADDSTWWETGRCDESCQRWVTACLLSRTNAYGVHVDISMRAPDDAPQKIKDALAVTDAERATYTLREGAYYGNLFATTPAAPAPAGFTGLESGPVLSTPSLYACAGPGSNIPELTKRFCSSQGDQVVINVPGTCLTSTDAPNVCDSQDSANDMRSCHPTTDRATMAYREVITVYLKRPITVCGNAVCEDQEADPTSPSYCPSDCHPGSWARSFDMALLSGFGNTLVTHKVATGSDNSIVIANYIEGRTPPFSLGGGVLTGSYPDQTKTDLVLVKYDQNGAHQWSFRQDNANTGVDAVAVGPDGTIVVVGLPIGVGSMRIAKYTATGSAATGWPVTLPNTGSTVDFGRTAIAVDGAGNVAVIASGMVYALAADGSVRWSSARPQAHPAGVAFDGSGNVVGTGTTPNGLFKLAASDGHELWTVAYPADVLEPLAVAADSAGNVYLSGDAQATADFGGGPQGLASAFVVSYTAAGAYRWNAHALSATGGNYAAYLNVDPSGNVIVGGGIVGTVDFGAGLFTTYATEDAFVAAYATDTSLPAGHSRLLWAKQVPMVLDNCLGGFTVDGRGHAVIAGGYSGSMQIDDQLLINSDPEPTFHQNLFLGSFAGPPTNDTTPPTIGAGSDQAGVRLNTVPPSFVAQATSAAGAVVFFMPPTAIDAANAGTDVSCSPAPNTLFPLGPTSVTCTASDPLGNRASASFTVTVVDTVGPLLAGVPAALTAPATSAAGAVVTFTLPTATDQVDGVRPVVCTPASGSTFPPGATTVRCSASDTRGNSGSAGFVVTVTDQTPPVLTVPAPITAEAQGPGGAGVVYAVSASDNVDGLVTPSCAPASGSTFPLGTTTVGCSAADAEGNTARASFTVTVVDTTPPELNLPASISVGATQAGGAVVTYSASATDLVDGPVAISCSPASGSLFATGATTVTCSASDAHGNRQSGSFQVNVGYAWSGFLQPIHADGSSVFQLGRTVPVKFQLTGASAGITNLVATLSLAKVSDSVTGTFEAAVSTSAADSGNTFRYDPTSGTYIFNLATSGLQTGTWSLAITMGDGLTRTVNISLR
jgi:hypothetical protein